VINLASISTELNDGDTVTFALTVMHPHNGHEASVGLWGISASIGI
jgi:hypothetical protein